jgi:hypothetical protein
MVAKNQFKNAESCRAQVAHSYNPSYLGSRDQEDCGSKPAHTNSLGDPNLEKIQHKKGLVEWPKV